jgi:hypothetical protein
VPLSPASPPAIARQSESNVTDGRLLFVALKELRRLSRPRQEKVLQLLRAYREVEQQESGEL